MAEDIYKMVARHGHWLRGVIFESKSNVWSCALQNDVLFVLNTHLKRNRKPAVKNVDYFLTFRSLARSFCSYFI